MTIRTTFNSASRDAARPRRPRDGFIAKRYVGSTITFETNGRACRGRVIAADDEGGDVTIKFESDDFIAGRTCTIAMRAANTREFGPCTSAIATHGNATRQRRDARRVA